MISVVVVDDEALVRYGFELILGASEDIRVVRTADGSGAVDAVRDTEPDVVLLDVRMPGRNGLEVLADLVELVPRPAVAMLTTFDTEEYLAPAIALGASGFLLKDVEPDALADYVRVLANGGLVLAPGVDRAALARPRSAPSGGPTLSEREIALLERLVRGATNTQMAEDLGISVTTVKDGIRQLQTMLEAPTRVQLALKAVEAGIVRV